MIKLPLEVVRGFWQRHPSVELCAKECGAECCRRGVEATVTPKEIERLNAKLNGTRLNVYWHPERKKWRWYIGKPCIFLYTGGENKNMCSIHEERPECCKRWPAKPTMWCPVWPVRK
jgi:Fe-S-cluster containining protein